MPFQFAPTDHEVLVAIADHRVLPVSQLAALLGRNPAALRRRLASLESEELIQIFSRPLSRSRGRPENLVSLCHKGVDLLKADGVIRIDAPLAGLTADGLTCLDHELLINDFRVQMSLLPRIIPTLVAQFLTPVSPITSANDHAPRVIVEQVQSNGEGGATVEFIPDAAFAIRNNGSDKTVLFFLEADRGTEPRQSGKGRNRGVQEKILNYQSYFAEEGYKRHESTLVCELRGFRLLILTERKTRHTQLCTLVRAMLPNGFIWLADRDTMLANGAWAAIWTRGGRANEGLQSILGSMLPIPCPTPNDVA